MTTELRTVFDTSAVVSAVLLPRSVPRQAFDMAPQIGRLLVSEATIEELDATLRRPKFDRYVSEVARLEFLTALVEQAEVVPIDVQIAECRDPKDNKFLELSVSGRASHLVSGDSDLLALHPFRGIQILRPDEFVKLFHSPGGLP